MAEYKVISADSHLNEPQEVYDRLPPSTAPAPRELRCGTTSDTSSSKARARLVSRRPILSKRMI